MTSWVATSLRWVPTPRPWISIGKLLVVVLEAQVRDELFPPQMAERVLELHELDEEVVLGVEAGGVHRALEVEGEPFLDAAHPRPPREVEEEGEVQHERGGQDGVAAEEVHLDLHGVAHPAEDV